VSSNGQGPLEDLVAEAERVLAAAGALGVPIRLTGGLAIRRRHPAATRPPLARSYADLDLAISSKAGRKAITEFMVRLGYVADDMFNTLHASQRLYYEDPAHGRHVDVFVDAVRMCHTIEFKDRLLYLNDTLSVTDLLLTKLQVVQLTHKDLLDTLAILHDQTLVGGAHDRLDSKYLEDIWGADWPIWRTSQVTLAKVREMAPTVLPPDGVARVSATIDALEHILMSGPKSLRWKVRSRVGDRVRWYQLPEEVDE
jgi:hypothetical protein